MLPESQGFVVWRKCMWRLLATTVVVSPNSFSLGSTIPVSNNRGYIRTKRAAATLGYRRGLTEEKEEDSDIFEQLNDKNGASEVKSDSNNIVDNKVPQCVRPDQYGDFGVETPFTDAALVAWTYQIQGLLEMTIPKVKEQIIPTIERKLSARLMEVLFNTPVCAEEGDDSLGATQLTNGERRTRGLVEIIPLVLDNGSEVIGLLGEPRDTIRNGHDGVLCENPVYIENAKRCFKLIGGLTLTGRKGDIDQAVQMAQEAIRSIMNEEEFLPTAHSSVLHVQYVESEPDYHEYFGSGNITGTEDVSGKANSSDSSEKEEDLNNVKPARDWPIWPFLAMGGSLVLSVVIVYMYWHRKRGSFGQIKTKRNQRMLYFSSSSDDSAISSRSSDAGDPQFTILSNTWRNIKLSDEPDARIDQTKMTDYSSDDTATADRSTSNASQFFDEGNPTKSQSQPFVIIGGLSETQQDPALQLSDGLLGTGSDKGSYDISLFTSDQASTNSYADNGDTTEDDTSEGSSTPSDSSPPPPQLPARRLRRSVL